jgi:YcaO-like protein with predicted kinase domain
MSPRDQARRALAEQICSLPDSKLLKEWGVTRVADVTGLDRVGLPVYTSVRPTGASISISGGKGISRIDSKCSAIVEAAELQAAENPWIHPDWVHCTHAEAEERYPNVVPFSLLQLSRDSPATRNTTPMAFDEMNDVLRNKPIVVPSDMIWMEPRVKTPFIYFQSSSSGLAGGVNEQDSMLQATLECIERDSWALAECVQERGKILGVVSLEDPLPEQVKVCVDHLKKAGVHPFLFDITTDVGVPTFRATILDDSPRSPGTFSGFGCSLDAEVAARRAITESLQARCAYISGARDDLFRRRFLLMKNIRTDLLLEAYRALPVNNDFSHYETVQFDSVESEWDAVVAKLKQAEISEVYCKTIYTSEDPSFCVVRVVCPELESPIWEHYATGKRAKKAIKELQDAAS